jgi:hypothetical protein
MDNSRTVALLIDDRPVLFSLRFALALQGFSPVGEDWDPSSCRLAPPLVIDQHYGGDGLEFLRARRAQGCAAPAIILATNPTTRLRSRAASLSARVVEKPLLGDELAKALLDQFANRQAA